jgi:hypothetical protein
VTTQPALCAGQPAPFEAVAALGPRQVRTKLGQLHETVALLLRRSFPSPVLLPDENPPRSIGDGRSLLLLEHALENERSPAGAAKLRGIRREGLLHPNLAVPPEDQIIATDRQ